MSPVSSRRKDSWTPERMREAVPFKERSRLKEEGQGVQSADPRLYKLRGGLVLSIPGFGQRRPATLDPHSGCLLLAV